MGFCCAYWSHGENVVTYRSIGGQHGTWSKKIRNHYLAIIGRQKIRNVWFYIVARWKWHSFRLYRTSFLGRQNGDIHRRQTTRSEQEAYIQWVSAWGKFVINSKYWTKRQFQNDGLYISTIYRCHLELKFAIWFIEMKYEDVIEAVKRCGSTVTITLISANKRIVNQTKSLWVKSFIRFSMHFSTHTEKLSIDRQSNMLIWIWLKRDSPSGRRCPKAAYRLFQPLTMSTSVASCINNTYFERFSDRGRVNTAFSSDFDYYYDADDVTVKEYTVTYFKSWTKMS